MAEGDSSLVVRARSLLRGKAATHEELYKLAMALKDQERQFGWARKLLAKARRPEPRAPDIRRRLRQKHALCTYKDPGLPADERLDRALEILREGEDLRTTTDQETLGLAGAIHKRRWEVDGQKKHLERALAYYGRGYREGVTMQNGEAVGGIAGDHGYNAINAAFVLDILADLELTEAEAAGATSEIGTTRQEEAREIRREVVRILPELSARTPALEKAWWFVVTVAEAYFGLGQYDDARPWLLKARELWEGGGVAAWERESFVRQLAAVVRLREPKATPEELERSRAGEALREFLLPGEEAGVFSALVGKMGLALSGGGFRAALFHIGVMAKLAEVDLLRHVEVLSCVSGGSIVGAHYYLKVRKLLEERADADITREHYVQLVREMADEFLAGVQENVRTRVGSNLLATLKMVFSGRRTRTQRLGELYEERIYARAAEAGVSPPVYLSDLLIRPEGKDFSPKDDNWKRRAKVPILIINAAALNTGHNWQFTATWMGESPAAINPEVDGNPRLRRMYYREAPERYGKFRLGEAVAASSAVPGLFPPIALAGLYPDYTVRLVDGGVHDNQGNVGLLEQGCNVVVVSDAGGQLTAASHPGGGILSVLMRSQGIQNARIREAQYRELDGRWEGSLLRNLTFLHLKSGLEVEPVDWVGCEDPRDPDRAAPDSAPLTEYGIRKDVQRLISGIRTDLDSFCDAEAFALMTSGYRMAEYMLPRSMKEAITLPSGPPPDWSFLAVEEAMNREPPSDLSRILAVARSRVFKIWRLSRPLKVAGVVLGAAAALGLGWTLWRFRDTPVLTLRSVFWTLVGVAAGVLGGKGLLRVVRYRTTLRETLGRIGFGLAMSLGGFLAARIHLAWFDRWYLRRGRVARREDGAAPA